MREILFRGKRVDNGEWVYGNVELQTVGQYTGMTDCEGNKIFEGDMLALSGSYEEIDGSSVDYTENYEVLYKNAAFYACNAEHKVMLSELVASMENTDHLEIAGNIYDGAGLW